MNPEQLTESVERLEDRVADLEARLQAVGLILTPVQHREAEEQKEDPNALRFQYMLSIPVTSRTPGGSWRNISGHYYTPDELMSKAPQYPNAVIRYAYLRGPVKDRWVRDYAHWVESRSEWALVTYADGKTSRDVVELMESQP